LSPLDQERYRKHFIEGVYAFLFRDLPADRAIFYVTAPLPESLDVGVTGRPGKSLVLTLKRTSEGYRITRIEKVEGAGR